MMDVKEKIMVAAGMAWERFRTTHPSQAAAVERDFDGDIVPKMMESLAQDQAYLELVAQTDAETNIAQIAGKLLPMLVSVAVKLLGI